MDWIIDVGSQDDGAEGCKRGSLDPVRLFIALLDEGQFACRILEEEDGIYHFSSLSI